MKIKKGFKKNYPKISKVKTVNFNLVLEKHSYKPFVNKKIYRKNSFPN